MAPNLDNLGLARVYRNPRTGKLVVDTDSLRRQGNFAGAADFGADRYADEEDDDYYDDDDDYDDDEDFEDDEFGDLEGDELGEDLGDEVGEDVGDVEGDDFGARGQRRRRRLRRRLGRLNRREARTRRKLRETRGRRGRRGKKVNWGMTAVGGTDHVDDAAGGAATVKVRLQHHFRALDLTFTGSVAGSKVTSIFFGDRVVWSNSDGIDTGVFASTGFLRGLLKGQSIRAGLDVIINGTVPTPGDFSVTLIGQKPIERC